MVDRIRLIVIVVITTVWALNFAAGLVPPLGYKPDQAINGIFMAIVGGFFALGARKGGSEDSSPPPGRHKEKDGAQSTEGPPEESDTP